jgi:type II secretory pathway component GspD/PulD (secretin)
VTQVLLSVEPEITSPESILMQIDVEIRDSGSGIANDMWNQSAGFGIGTTGIGIPNARKTLQTYARVKDGGTTVLGGWTAEIAEDLESGTPGLRDIPWIGKMFFSHNVHSKVRTNLLIFLSANLVD